MTHDSWRIIPKRSRWSELTLKVEVRPSDGFRRLRLCIPIHLRKRSEYFEGCALAYCNLLEEGPLVMVQFIPKEAMVDDSHVIHHGQLYLARDVLRVDPGRGGRFAVPYKLDKGNIVIDRRELGDLREVE